MSCSVALTSVCAVGAAPAAPARGLGSGLLGVGLALALRDRLPEALTVAVADCVSMLAVAEPVLEGV